MGNKNSTPTLKTGKTTTSTFTLIDLVMGYSDMLGMITSHLKKPEWGLFIACKGIRRCYLDQAGIVLGSPGMNFLRDNYEALQYHVNPKWGLMQCIRMINLATQRHIQILDLNTLSIEKHGNRRIKAIGLNKTTFETLDHLPSLLPLLNSLGLEGIHIDDQTVSKISKLLKLRLLILESCEISEKFKNLTQIEELRLTSFNSDSSSPKHVSETIKFSRTLKKLVISEKNEQLEILDKNEYCPTTASAKLCTQLDCLELSNLGNHNVPLVIEFPRVPCLKTLKIINSPVKIIQSGNPFENVIDISIDWCAIKHLSRNMHRKDMTTFFKEQTCLLFSLLDDFKHFENLCIDNYECKPCLFVILPAGTQKTLVTLISKKKTTKLAKKITLPNDQHSTTRQSISKKQQPLK